MGKKIKTDNNANMNSIGGGGCPYYDVDRIECQAATSKYYLDRKVRLRFCLDDNFESCPVFLAKILRGGRVEACSDGPRRRCLTLTGSSVDAYRYNTNHR
jgi:hypothetical protein